MKAVWLAAMSVGVTAAFGGAVVESENSVGVLEIAVTADVQQLVAVPFTGYGGGPLKVDEAVKTAGLGAGSRISVSKTGDSYETWTLDEGGKWRPDRQVLLGASGSVESVAAAASEAFVMRGDAFWLQPKASDGTVYLTGVPSDDAAAMSLSDGWNLIGNPTLAPFDVSSAVPSPQAGDLIEVNNKGFRMRYTYCPDDRTGDMGWCVRRNGVLTASVVGIAAGEGCWIFAQPRRGTGK